ncbi:DDE transposase [Acidaminobacter sp. JC074]|uniref:transposase n=1 Tax=Acidaminobacter sp. JC074 TaxID=2530199 RepID=UPI001F0F404C|nr:transposase [Acidaminobacter sp. JC074]MCH4888391.1 DDE transposase [Acidaminobacter sp. JC074]
MLNLANQITIFELDKEINELTLSHEFVLFDLFESFIDLKSLIPLSFYQDYYHHLGRERTFPLEGMIKAILIADLIGISSTTLLLHFIRMSHEFRDFLRFPRTPHKSRFTRFKLQFYDHINDMFHHLVDYTDIYAHSTDKKLANILVTDITGFELYVKENNPKFYQQLLKASKTFAKVYPNEKFDPEKHAQSRMPKTSAANPDAKFTYLNGHFGYYRKSIISTNGFGLIRDINFINSNNDLVEDLSPKEIKDLYDSKSLIPSLETYFHLHPTHNYDYFLGDSAFDADDNYAYLHNRKIMPIIPLNPRNSSNLPQPSISNGLPMCPYNPELPMKFTGFIYASNRADRAQYICPKRTKKMIKGVNHIFLDCDNPCTDAPHGRIKNITINHNYRFYSAMSRDSEEWIELYKIRTVSERTIHQLKSFINLNDSKVRNTMTLQANVLLAGIAQLVAFLILYHSKLAKGPLAIRTLIS